MTLNEAYPVYGLLREHPVARRKARRFREKLLAFEVEDGLKVRTEMASSITRQVWSTTTQIRSSCVYTSLISQVGAVC